MGLMVAGRESCEVKLVVEHTEKADSSSFIGSLLHRVAKKMTLPYNSMKEILQQLVRLAGTPRKVVNALQFAIISIADNGVGRIMSTPERRTSGNEPKSIDIPR